MGQKRRKGWKREIRSSRRQTVLLNFKVLRQLTIDTPVRTKSKSGDEIASGKGPKGKHSGVFVEEQGGQTPEGEGEDRARTGR